jgi:hypothetical protein
MKMSKHRRLREGPLAAQRTQVVQGALPGHAAPSLPTLVAGIFTKLRLAQRVRVLRRLLLPVGPMALAVLGGGAFAKFVGQARWPRMSISLEDAARVTSSQMFELVRYVEQSHPQALQQVMVVLSRDAATVAAVGASVAVLVMRHLSNRNDLRARFAYPG